MKSLDSLPHNLPAELTSFVGRETQLLQVKERLKNTRLLTLTGSGGSGKTRLALQAAADLLEKYPDGVWLIELAALTDSELVAQTTATVLGVREQPGRTVTESLVDSLKPQTTLLVLDNCEHLRAACARLADTLLRACPSLRILATSRALLGIAGENIESVPPLGLPDVSNLLPDSPKFIAALMGGEATGLFLERAFAVQPSFAVTAHNAPALLDICRRLDGIPLAIELAAVRIKMLSAEQIAARLDNRFRLLTDKNRQTDLPRQQTLRAMIDWSYDLLKPAEQVLLRRLSVFAGGWTLEAAEAICAGEKIDESEVLDLLSQLVDQSLVLGAEHLGVIRYRLLESVREYAREKLEDTAVEAKFAADCHGAWYSQWANYRGGEEEALWLERTQSEYDNLRISLAWSLKQTQPEFSLRLAGSLWRFWTVRGYLREGRNWLAQALALPGSDAPGVSPARARALTGAGSLAWNQGDYSAARALLEESLSLRRHISDAQGVADALNNLGNVAADQGDYPAARALLEESLLSMRLLSDAEGIAATVSNLARIAFWQGDFDVARALYAESLEGDRQRGDDWGAANTLCGLALLEVHSGDMNTAHWNLRESLTLRQRLSDTEGMIECLEVFAALASAQGRFAQVVSLVSVSERARNLAEAPLPLAADLQKSEMLAAARAVLSSEDYDAAWKQGHAMSVKHALRHALRLELAGPCPLGISIA